MSNNNKQNNETDKIMDGFYYYIGYHHTENNAKILDKIKEGTDTNNINYPKELNEWFNDYINKSKKLEKKNKRIKKINSLSKRVAIILITLVICITTITFSVEAFRIKVLNFIIDKQERYTSIEVSGKQVENEKGKLLDNWTDFYLPDYVPEGFEIVNAEKYGNIRIIYYENKDGVEIEFSQSPNGNNHQLDTENAQIDKIKIKDKEAILIEKNGLITLLWYNDEDTFNLIGKTDKNEIIKMAKSIRKNN